MNQNIRLRTYIMSINILFFSFYSNSKIYEIKEGESTILPGIKYSLMTLLFGWWGFGFPQKMYYDLRNSLNALHINFSGGTDYTKELTELEYEEKTVWVYNNLSRLLFEKTNIEIIDLIIDLQNDLLNSNSEITLEKNIMYLNENLKKINSINLRNSDLEEIITKIKQFDLRN